MEWELYKHLKTDHREAFADIFSAWGKVTNNDQKRKKAHDESFEEDVFLRVISDYMAAVCEKEREGMPTIGIAKDRQLLRSLNAVMDGVSSRICFGCAQVYTNVPLWSHQYGAPRMQTGHLPTMQTGHHVCPDTGDEWSEHPWRGLSLNDIEKYSIKMSLEKYYYRNERRFSMHFNYSEFKQRYAMDAADGNPFRNSELLREMEHEWVRSIQMGNDAKVDVLCCPEDVEQCHACQRSRRNSLCGNCKVQLCHNCASCVVQDRAQEIPMVLCNDNFWGYTTDLLYKHQVTWLEAAIVQPCWTTMMVCYVEGDEGHQGGLLEGKWLSPLAWLRLSFLPGRSD